MAVKGEKGWTKEKQKEKEQLAAQGLKKCSNSKCSNPIKSFSEFNRRADRKDGYRSECKECGIALTMEWKENNPEKLQEYIKNNPEVFRKKEKKWRDKNLQKVKETRKNRDKEKYTKDPLFKIKIIVSCQIRRGLRDFESSKDGETCWKYLPYTPEELYNHLESLFEPWMTRENQGIYRKDKWDDNDPSTWRWQIDHRIAQSLLPYKSMAEENFQKCWALSNLQPLSAKENLLKSNKTLEEWEEQLNAPTD